MALFGRDSRLTSLMAVPLDQELALGTLRMLADLQGVRVDPLTEEWPPDNALVAAGLMRCGYVPEAQQVALGILDAARAFGGRLPELFCGFDRDEFPAPVPLPHVLLAAGVGRGDPGLPAPDPVAVPPRRAWGEGRL
jgi:glycogen debranching enzyme